MKYAVKVDADNRNVDVSVSVKKEDGEPDFFENIGEVFNGVKIGKDTPDGAIDIIDAD